MHFFSWRNITFQTFCVQRDTHGLNMLAWRSFFSSTFPWWCDHGDATLPIHRERQVSIQTSVPSHFLSRIDPLRLVLSGNFVDTAWRHPESGHGYRILGAKITFFLLIWENATALQLLGNPSNCCFLPSDNDSFGPSFGISESSRRLTTPSLWPIPRGMSSHLGKHSIGTIQSQTLSYSLFPHGQSLYELGCLWEAWKVQEKQCLDSGS